MSDDDLTRLFREMRAALFRYVKRRVGSAQIADEIVQEAFLRTHQQGAALRAPRAFLFCAAKNLALNQRRHQRIALEDPIGTFDDLGVLSLKGGPSAEDEAIAVERSRLIERALQQLPRQCGIVFRMRMFQGYNYREIATRLGVSTKTVEKHIARGIREMHTLLGGHNRL